MQTTANAPHLAQPAHTHEQTEMTVGSWLLTFLIQMIPLVGFIMLFVWGFGDGTRPARRTYAQAVLALFAALVALYVLFVMVIGVSFMSLFGG
jgi:hypothetical protein